jgi:hypothetical protein
MKSLHTQATNSKWSHSICNALEAAHALLYCRGAVLIIHPPTISSSRLLSIHRRAALLSRAGYQVQVISMPSSCNTSADQPTACPSEARQEPSTRPMPAIQGCVSSHNASYSVRQRMWKALLFLRASLWSNSSSVEISRSIRFHGFDLKPSVSLCQ